MAPIPAAYSSVWERILLDSLFVTSAIATPQKPESVAVLVTALMILLLVATGVALLSWRLRVPYVTGLVLAGLGIPDLLPERIGPDSSLILNLFLPILLLEAAINTNISRLRKS